MKEKQELILNNEEAFAAICMDLRRYEPQPMLCAEVLRVALKNAAAVKRDPGRDGLWVRMASQTHLRYMEGAGLIDYIADSLTRAALSPQEVAGLCRRVFQTPVQVKPSGEAGRMRLHIDTGMDGFQCRLCGNCCRNLDYHQELNANDVTRWKAEGRADILKWVGITKGQDEQTSYRIWVVPETNQFAPICPFLKNGHANGQWICAIQKTKPEICHHYPSTRKHGLMTGCRGFEPQ